MEIWRVDGTWGKPFSLKSPDETTLNVTMLCITMLTLIHNVHMLGETVSTGKLTVVPESLESVGIRSKLGSLSKDAINSPG